MHTRTHTYLAHFSKGNKLCLAGAGERGNGKGVRGAWHSHKSKYQTYVSVLGWMRSEILIITFMAFSVTREPLPN